MVKTQDWIEALSNEINERFLMELGEAQGLTLMSDNGSQYTSVKWIAACKAMEIKQLINKLYNSQRKCRYGEGYSNDLENFICPRDWFSFQQLN